MRQEKCGAADRRLRVLQEAQYSTKFFIDRETPYAIY